MKDMYKNSIKALKKLVKQNKNLTMQEWEQYAHENNLFTASVIIGKENVQDWEELKKYIKWFF